MFEYAFKHPLTHEVAYQSQLQSRRAVVHAAVARALETQAGDKLNEHAALLAHHCEAAGEVRNAARWHQRAAEWAGLNDVNAALHHWLRVRELAKQGGDDVELTNLLALACSQALPFAWRVGASSMASAELFEEGCKAAERSGNLPALATLNAVYGAALGYNQAAAHDHARYTTEAVRIADLTGDAALRAGTRAELVAGHMSCGQLREAERIADEVIALASGDPHLGVEVIGCSPLMSARALRLLAVGSLRDPVTALRELLFVRRVAVEAGYPEPALWAAFAEIELKYALCNRDGIHALAQTAMRLAKNLGALNELYAAIGECDALACDNDWRTLLDTSTDLLRGARELAVGRPWEPRLLALIGIAQLELGSLEAGRAAAQEGVALMRESQSLWNPHSYAVLARAQLALSEPAADIALTLDEYEALLTRTGFHVYEGELHELRARLAGREGQRTEQAAALAHAHACYTRFGMIAQAGRVADHATLLAGP